MNKVLNKGLRLLFKLMCIFEGQALNSFPNKHPYKTGKMIKAMTKPLQSGNFCDFFETK